MLAFNDLFNKNVPHILEKIFIENLDDHRDYENCHRVCSTWKNYFESQFETREIIGKKIKSRKISSDWTKRRDVWTKIEFGDVLQGKRISFVDANEKDFIVVLTKHGMKNAVILKFDVNTLRLTASTGKEFPSAITKIQASDAFIFVFPYREKAVVLRRSTLEDTLIDVQGIKGFSVVGSTAFNLLKKSPLSNEYILRRLEFPQEKILRYRTISQANHHLNENCGAKERLFAIDGQSLCLFCRHGFVQLFDLGKNAVEWSHKAIPSVYGADEIIHGPFLLKKYVAVVFGFHLPGCETEHIIQLYQRKSGNLIEKFVLRSNMRILTAASDDKFVFGQRQGNNRISFTTFHLSQKRCSNFSTRVDSNFQDISILGDRILLVQSMVGTAGQRRGELLIFDLEQEGQTGSMNQRKINDLMFSGPLNKKLITLAGESTFIAQTQEGLFKVAFQD